MRKGALKKKRRQLEELHLDRREALGELALGMYVQGNWDDNLLARGAAEVAEVERELRMLTGPKPDSGPAEQPSGELTGEHDLPPTGEYTAEHDLPPTGEHVLRRPGEHTEEHLLPSWRSEADAEPGSPAAPPKPASSEKPAEPERPKVAKKPSDPAEGAGASKPGIEPAPAPESKPPTVAPTPSATAPAPAAAAPGEAPSPAPDVPESPLLRLGEKIEADTRRARNAIDAAKATLKSDSRTETAVIAKEVAEGHEQLTATLKEAAALITGAEERAAVAEAKLRRESAAAREAAAGWVRSQAAEIEADAALAVEIEQEEGITGDPPAPDRADPVLAARVAALEAELAAEKAAKAEALVKAEARLKEIEANARAAEERVAAATEAATAAPAPETATTESRGRSEAETREAAVAWLRGQIGALRKELAGQGETPAKPAGNETGQGDS